MQRISEIVRDVRRPVIGQAHRMKRSRPDFAVATALSVTPWAAPLASAVPEPFTGLDQLPEAGEVRKTSTQSPVEKFSWATPASNVEAVATSVVNSRIPIPREPAHERRFPQVWTSVARFLRARGSGRPAIDSFTKHAPRQEFEFFSGLGSRAVFCQRGRIVMQRLSIPWG